MPTECKSGRTIYFLEKCERLMRPYVEHSMEIRRTKRRSWIEENPEKFKKSRDKYIASEKGKVARKRVAAIRHSRVRDLIKELTEVELEDIRNFYVNCPPGYEVDHIIPISKNGKHILSNLQYLTSSENRRKSAKILEEYKHLV